MPQVVALLHSQPEIRTVATELPEAHRHVRADAGGAGKDPVKGLAGHPELSCRLAHREVERR